jgi:hypothetical protein
MISYALTGGLAVSIYTRPRATEDIDLFIAPADLERLIAAVEPLGYHRSGRPMRLAAGRLEIQRLTKIEGPDLLPVMPNDATLTALLTDRTRVDTDSGGMWVVGLSALRTLKRLRGSPLDLADLEALGPGQ